MMAVQNQTTMYTADTNNSVVLWSDRCQGNLYLMQKNTFLEIEDEEKKALKRSACARSASVDSHFNHSQSHAETKATSASSLLKSCDQSTQSTATPTNRSSSPSNHSLLSIDNGVIVNADLQSPGTTPRACNSTYQQQPDANSNLKVVSLAAAMGTTTPTRNRWSDCDITTPAGHGMPMMFMMMPVPPYVNESQREMRPQVVEPRSTNEEETTSQGRPARKRQESKVKKFDKVAAAPMEEALTEVTTLMVRGIPCSFSQDALLSLIDNAGLQGKYDFFYLPRDGKRNANLGYAFINFVDEQSAEVCTAALQDVPLSPARSKKTCTISAAAIQGLPSLWKHFHNTAVTRGSSGPMFLTNQEEVSQSKTFGVRRS